jgi:hypothetical protein
VTCKSKFKACVEDVARDEAQYHRPTVDEILEWVKKEVDKLIEDKT